MLAILLAAQLTAQGIMEEAFRSQGEDPANVEIMEVDADHWFLNESAQRRLARAARNAEGDEMIVIQKNPKTDLEPLIQHEAAHLIAWRLHGEDIKEHGLEFKSVCRAVVTTRQAHFCKY